MTPGIAASIASSVPLKPDAAPYQGSGTPAAAGGVRIEVGEQRQVAGVGNQRRRILVRCRFSMAITRSAPRISSASVT